VRHGRKIDFMGFGPRDGFADIQGLIMIYAQRNIDKVAQALTVDGLNGEPALLAPQ
jgi:hypothetical protein